MGRAVSGRIARRAAALSGVLAFAVTALAGPAAAGEDPSGSEGAQTLADRYAPIIRLKAQEHECDADGEPYAPTSVDVVLDNPDVLLRQVGTDDPVIMRAPTAADIFDGGEGVYLDWTGAARRPIVGRRGPPDARETTQRGTTTDGH